MSKSNTELTVSYSLPLFKTDELQEISFEDNGEKITINGDVRVEKLVIKSDVTFNGEVRAEKLVIKSDVTFNEEVRTETLTIQHGGKAIFKKKPEVGHTIFNHVEDLDHLSFDDGIHAEYLDLLGIIKAEQGFDCFDVTNDYS